MQGLGDRGWAIACFPKVGWPLFPSCVRTTVQTLADPDGAGPMIGRRLGRRLGTGHFDVPGRRTLAWMNCKLSAVGSRFAWLGPKLLRPRWRLRRATGRQDASMFPDAEVRLKRIAKLSIVEPHSTNSGRKSHAFGRDRRSLRAEHLGNGRHLGIVRRVSLSSVKVPCPRAIWSPSDLSPSDVPERCPRAMPERLSVPERLSFGTGTLGTGHFGGRAKWSSDAMGCPAPEVLLRYGATASVWSTRPIGSRSTLPFRTFATVHL